MISAILEQSTVFLPFSLGVFLSYGVLRKADLTVDGSFVLGAAIYGLTVLSGGNPFVGLILSALSGFVAGGAVALLQYQEKMTPLIAGILALFMLQSINLFVMGRPNLNLLAYPNLPSFSITITLFLAILLLMHCRLGLLFRAFGDNPSLMKLMGYRTERFRFLGLGFSNSLVGLSGALTSQYQGYVDVGMGAGNVLVGIGTVIIGQQLIRGHHRGIAVQVLACVAGTIIYFTVLNTLVSLGVNPVFLKLALGGFIAALLLQSKPCPEAVP